MFSRWVWFLTSCIASILQNSEIMYLNKKQTSLRMCCHQAMFPFAEKICANLTDFQDGTVAVNNPASYQDTANYTCNDGYHISIGVYSDIVTCTQHGNWSAGHPLCAGMCSLIAIVFKFIRFVFLKV